MPDRAIELAEAVRRAGVAHTHGDPPRRQAGQHHGERNGQVKVTDFRSRATSNETIAQTAAVLGTASYLARAGAGRSTDQRSDLYRLGAFCSRC
jgi:hypothetical protein